MKRRIGVLVLIIVIFVVAIGTAIYLNMPERNPKAIFGSIPTSKPHQHATPDGDLVEHVHTYDLSFDIPKLFERITSKDTDIKKHPIQLDWERIDLDTVRKKYQPYNVAEMHKMWAQTYRAEESTNKRVKLDKAYPPDKWLKRNIELGQPITNYSDYRMVLQRRIYMVNRRDLWHVVGAEDKEAMRKNLDLPPEINTWKKYEDAYLKFWIVASYESLLADKTETVYAHVVDRNRFSKFTGARLNRKEKYNLMVYGNVPDGIHVVYLDENGELLPPRVKPRFYERYMKELVQTQANVEKMIVDHKAFFISHSKKNAKRPAQREIQESFVLLQDLHWGEFPKDLQTLQDAISKLEKIKQTGEEKIVLPH